MAKPRARDLGLDFPGTPGPNNALTEKMFARGLSRDTILVRDLQTFDLPPDSTEIHIREP
jgi:hypothetical protein